MVGVAECGNGRLEEGEQCDCGKPGVEYCFPDKQTHMHTGCFLFSRIIVSEKDLFDTSFHITGVPLLDVWRFFFLPTESYTTQKICCGKYIFF